MVTHYHQYTTTVWF